MATDQVLNHHHLSGFTNKRVCCCTCRSEGVPSASTKAFRHTKDLTRMSPHVENHLTDVWKNVVSHPSTYSSDCKHQGGYPGKSEGVDPLKIQRCMW
eukprot:scaffold4206_cov16-Tisochrysis_lutea.AAC.6